jgi:hypothetical protein
MLIGKRSATPSDPEILQLSRLEIETADQQPAKCNRICAVAAVRSIPWNAQAVTKLNLKKVFEAGNFTTESAKEGIQDAFDW